MDIQEKLKELKQFYENGFITKETWELEQQKLLELWRSETSKAVSPDEKTSALNKNVEDVSSSSVFLEFSENSKTLIDSKEFEQNYFGTSSLNISCEEILHGNSYVMGKFVPAQYEIIKVIGKGGMGEVYLASNIVNSEKVAIKFLIVDTDEKMMDRFFRELQLLMSLEHPNIVAYRGQGNHENKAFIVMEYVNGENLSEVIVAKQRLNVEVIIHIARQLVDVLMYARQNKIVHRDIKPANIIINEQNTIKLIDLGMSKALDNTLKITRTGEFMGSPLYMAPEQITCPGKDDYMSDVYAFGATLYHLLCGVAPFSEYTNISQILFAKANNRYIPLSERKVDIPSHLVKIVESTMKPISDQRLKLESIKQLLQNI